MVDLRNEVQTLKEANKRLQEQIDKVGDIRSTSEEPVPAIPATTIPTLAQLRNLQVLDQQDQAAIFSNPTAAAIARPTTTPEVQPVAAKLHKSFSGQLSIRSHITIHPLGSRAIAADINLQVRHL